ncbi:MAG: TlpA family protein disulfide reductase, partial [bacterium]
LLDGSIAPESEWQDKIRVVNFWATWCPPCRKEMPVFIKLQNQFASQNVQFLGIAIDDRAAVQDFVDQYGINFPTLIGDERALNLSRDLGNRYGGLPFTAIVDQSGKVVIRHTGELSEDRLRVALEELVSTGKTRS